MKLFVENHKSFESLKPRSKTSIYYLEINDCRDDSCYPGVKCIDLMAPKRGFKCDKCPEGFTGNGMSCEKQGKCNSKVVSSLRDIEISYDGRYFEVSNMYKESSVSFIEKKKIVSIFTLAISTHWSK